MIRPKRIDSTTIEIHRLGGQGGRISEGDRYIALFGGDARPAQPTMSLDHEEFMINLNTLRYLDDVDEARVACALDKLGAVAASFLPCLEILERGRGAQDRDSEVADAHQVDLVLGAAELWAIPFEACCMSGMHVFADPQRRIIVTRRIRQGFVGPRIAWPVRPRILFAHAPAARDLAEDLITDHIKALEDALAPWSSSGSVWEEGLLQVSIIGRERDLAEAVAKARQAGKPFSHVHLLAHGKAIKDRLSGSIRWGLRLGDQHREASEPERLAQTLVPHLGLPTVVTVGACDSANQSQTFIPERSFAQELHKTGIPVVLASQLPLTQHGSVIMTRVFYEALLHGDDVRWALHQTRLALACDKDAGHDWVGVVGYVQLAEGYDDHLMKVGLELEMELLKAAWGRRDHAFVRQIGANIALEESLRERLESLEHRLSVIPAFRKDLHNECQGILASANKRLAEVLYLRAKLGDREHDPTECLRRSRAHLEAALYQYSEAFRSNIHHHWSGVQKLSLEAVLNGLVDRREWNVAMQAAEVDIAQSTEEVWAFGSIAELCLLAPIAREPKALDRAGEAIRQGRDRALSDKAKKGAAFFVESTRDQLNRYIGWWTKENGFFGPCEHDLKADAAELLNHLEG